MYSFSGMFGVQVDEKSTGSVYFLIAVTIGASREIRFAAKCGNRVLNPVVIKEFAHSNVLLSTPVYVVGKCESLECNGQPESYTPVTVISAESAD